MGLLQVEANVDLLGNGDFAGRILRLLVAAIFGSSLHYHARHGAGATLLIDKYRRA